MEEVGSLSPLTKNKVLKEERLKYWLSVGAKPSDTVYNLLVSKKIIEGKKIPAHKKSKKPASAEATVSKPVETPAVPAPEAPATEVK